MRRTKAQKLFESLTIPVLFLCLALVFWLWKGESFFLFNFLYIGGSISLGIGLLFLLPRTKKTIARKITLILIGGYMLGFLGFFKMENMQLEGFFFYLLQGSFLGAFIHYLVAKIFGPFLFNRAWCGWACWTAMILDLLPYKKGRKRLSRGWEKVRYLHFFLIACLVAGLFFFSGYSYRHESESELFWLIIGNAVYYLAALLLAYALRDNRAFCKYLCPITLFLKVGSRFSLLKVSGKKEECTLCRRCAEHCPMDIRVFDYIQNDSRVLSTECILCMECIHACPSGTLDVTLRPATFLPLSTKP